MVRAHRITVSLAFLLAAVPADAADWQVSGFLAQRFEADSNADLDPDDADAAYGSVTDVGLRVRAVTGTTTWLFAPGVRASIFGGPGGGGDLNDVQPRFNGNVTHRAPRYLINGALSVIPEFGSDANFDDTGNTDRTLLRVTGSAGIVYSLDTDDRLSVNSFVELRDFTSDALSFSPTASWGSSVSWARDLTPRTTGSLTASFRDFTSQEDDDESGQTYEIRLGGTHQASQQLSVDASAGVSLTDSTRRLGGGGNEDDRSVGFVGGINAIYSAAPDTSVAAGINQTVEQTSIGNIENRLGVNFSATHDINTRSRFSLVTRAGFQNPAFSGANQDNRRTLSIAPTYSHDLSADWRARVGYILRLEDEDSDTAMSNIVFVSISRGFDFLP